MNETPEDMADFIEYAKGPAESRGAQRARPTGIPSRTAHYMELGNEERVERGILAEVRSLAEALWARDPR